MWLSVVGGQCWTCAVFAAFMLRSQRNFVARIIRL